MALKAIQQRNGASNPQVVLCREGQGKLCLFPLHKQASRKQELQSRMQSRKSEQVSVE